MLAMWFTETPWPPIFLFCLSACILLTVWYAKQKATFLVVAGLMLVAAVGTYFVEQLIVTDAEKIEQNVHDLAAAFQRKDADATLNYFSVQAPDLRALVSAAIAYVDVNNLDIKDVQVSLVAAKSRGLSTFRANGTATVPSMSASQHMATMWRLTWQKEAGDWKIVEIAELNPMNGEDRRDSLTKKIPVRK